MTTCVHASWAPAAAERARRSHTRWLIRRAQERNHRSEGLQVTHGEIRDPPPLAAALEVIGDFVVGAYRQKRRAQRVLQAQGRYRVDQLADGALSVTGYD